MLGDRFSELSSCSFSLAARRLSGCACVAKRGLKPLMLRCDAPVQRDQIVRDLLLFFDGGRQSFLGIYERCWQSLWEMAEVPRRDTQDRRVERGFRTPASLFCDGMGATLSTDGLTRRLR